jgi:hypothetical protein
MCGAKDAATPEDVTQRSYLQAVESGGLDRDAKAKQVRAAAADALHEAHVNAACGVRSGYESAALTH